MTDETTQSGWEVVAAEDEGAAVIAGLLEIDADREYTRTELADAVGLPLKTLYLIEILDTLETAGMVDRVDAIDAESEASFTIDEDSAVYEAARQFDEVLGNKL